MREKNPSRHTSCLKLKSAGKGRPFGRRAFGSRSSSKKGCAHASNCDPKVNCPISVDKLASQAEQRKCHQNLWFFKRKTNG